jgi:hypothetical protein
MNQTTTTSFADPELVDFLADEPELLAIADAVLMTTCGRAHSSLGRSRGRMLTLVGLPSLVLAAAIIALAFLWPFSSSPSVLDNALAAIGSRPVTHVVLEDNLGSYLLDPHTNKRMPTRSRVDIWVRPAHGILIRTTFLGTRTAVYVPFARTYLHTYMDRIPLSFASGYRAHLRAHSLRVSHAGTIDGKPVYWIEGKPRFFGGHSEVEQVAISKTTYKPLYYRYLRDGRIERGSGVRVLSIETTNLMPPAPPSSRFPYSQSFGYRSMTLKQALAMRPRPRIPEQIGGLRLAVVGHSPFQTGANLNMPVPGVWLYYGTAPNTRLPTDIQPSYKGAYIEIFEFPHANPVTHYYAGHFPSDGVAVIDALSATGHLHTATIKTHNRYYIINASSDNYAKEAALAAAR